MNSSSSYAEDEEVLYEMVVVLLLVLAVEEVVGKMRSGLPQVPLSGVVVEPSQFEELL